jgi:hypothetical protein
MNRSAAEDFKERSLRALPTLLERLAYICSLQNESGSYEHWGLSRVFGNRLAQDAILRVPSPWGRLKWHSESARHT